MVKKGLNTVILSVPEEFITKYCDHIVQIEPFNFVYYVGGTQYSSTRFLCEVIHEEEQKERS